MLKNPWDYRYFIRASIKREFQSQYSKSILGTAWIIMNPLYMCVIYTFIFSSVMSPNGDHSSYTLYVASGLLAWHFFIDILNRSQSIYLSYANIMKQQCFPFFCLPMIVLSLACFDFLISFGLFTSYLVATHAFPGWCYFAVIPVLILQAFYALSLGTLLGILNIFFRDIGRALVVILQVWFWLTPIVYHLETIPKNMQRMLQFNPLTPLMTAYQTILVKQQWPDWDTLLFPFIITLLIGGLFSRFYHRHSHDLLDEL